MTKNEGNDNGMRKKREEKHKNNKRENIDNDYNLKRKLQSK